MLGFGFWTQVGSYIAVVGKLPPSRMITHASERECSDYERSSLPEILFFEDGRVVIGELWHLLLIGESLVETIRRPAWSPVGIRDV